MKSFNYITLFIALFMMNIMHAELRTWGMPSDSGTEEAPSEQLPTEEAPSEETPSEETPSEETPDEEIPSEEAEMPSAEEDSIGQPIEFKEEYVFSTNLGMMIPIGSNINPEFNSGSNINIGIKTPFSFNLGNKSVSIFANMSISKLGANPTDYRVENNLTYDDYSITSFGIGMGTEIVIFDMSINLGMSSLKGTTLDTNSELSSTVPYLGLELGYTLPTNTLFEKLSPQLSNLSINVNAGGSMIMGAPSEEAASSNVMTFGLELSYPFLF